MVGTMPTVAAAFVGSILRLAIAASSSNTFLTISIVITLLVSYEIKCYNIIKFK